MSRVMAVPWVADCRCGDEVIKLAPRHDGNEGRWVRCDCGQICHTRKKLDIGEASKRGLIAP